VSGEFIKFSVEIDNRTKKKLADINVQLKQQIRLHAEELRNEKYKIKTREIELGRQRCPIKVRPNRAEKWLGSFQVPTVCPSLKGICRIIEIDYFFVLHLKAGLFSISKEFSIPITLGTVPYRNSTSELASAAGISNSCSFESGPLRTSSSLSYSFCEKAESIESNHASYSPVYPFYKDFAS
jgi:hypothetical protein